MSENIIRAKIVFDTSAVKNLKGNLGAIAGDKKGGIGAISGVGGKGGLLAAGAIAGAVAAGVTAVIGVLKKGFEALKKASPALQATFNVFGKGIMLLLRPIADVLNFFVRPMAILFIRYAIKFYKNWKKTFGEWFKKDKKDGDIPSMGDVLTKPSDEASQHLDELRQNIDANAEAYGGLNTIIKGGVDLWVALGGILKIVWGVLKGVAGVVILLTKGFLYLLNEVLKPFEPILAIFADSLNALGNFFSDIGTAIWNLATGGSWDEFMEAMGLAWEELKKWAVKKFFDPVKETWNNFVKWINDNVINPIGESLKSIGTWFETYIIDPIKKGWENLKDWIGKNIIDPMKEKFEKIASIIKTITIPYARPLERQHGGNIFPGQNYLVGERGPELITPTKSGFVHPTGSFGGGVNVTINVNALDSGSINSSTLNMITNAVSDAMRRNITGRTTETFGIGG